MQLDQFLTLVDEAISAQGLIMTRPDPDDPLSGTVEPGVTVTLSHLYQACADTSESDARQEIDKFAASLKLAASENPFPDHWDEVRAKLLPILRDKGSIHSSCLASAAGKGEDDYDVFPHHEIGPELIALIAVDFDESIAMPNSVQLQEWERSFEDAYAQAMTNLAEREPGPMQDNGNGLFGWFNSDDYESSRLLLPAFWDGLPELAGNPVIICPSKDSLLLTGADNAEGLEDMAHQAANIIQECRPLSGLAMVRRNDEWHPFPGPEDSGAEALGSLRRQWLSLLHDEQKDLLDEMLEQQARDIHVGSHKVARQLPDVTGERSFTSWTDGVHAWLPEAEMVFFVRSRDDISFAPWDAVRATLGQRMSPTHHYPLRFEVDGYPTEEDFSAMNAQPLKQKKKRRFLPW